MMYRSKTVVGQTRPILKHSRKNSKKNRHAVQPKTQDEPSNKDTNLSRDALRGGPLAHSALTRVTFGTSMSSTHFPLAALSSLYTRNYPIVP